MPKTGCSHQWEKTGQIKQCGPWAPLPVWPWLWTCGFREQSLSGKPDLEQPAAHMQRWETKPRNAGGQFFFCPLPIIVLPLPSTLLSSYLCQHSLSALSFCKMSYIEIHFIAHHQRSLSDFKALLDMKYFIPAYMSQRQPRDKSSKTVWSGWDLLLYWLPLTALLFLNTVF